MWRVYFAYMTCTGIEEFCCDEVFKTYADAERQAKKLRDRKYCVWTQIVEV